MTSISCGSLCTPTHRHFGQADTSNHPPHQFFVADTPRTSRKFWPTWRADRAELAKAGVEASIKAVVFMANQTVINPARLRMARCWNSDNGLICGMCVVWLLPRIKKSNLAAPTQPPRARYSAPARQWHNAQPMPTGEPERIRTEDYPCNACPRFFRINRCNRR